MLNYFFFFVAFFAVFFFAAFFFTAILFHLLSREDNFLYHTMKGSEISFHSLRKIFVICSFWMRAASAYSIVIFFITSFMRI